MFSPMKPVLLIRMSVREFLLEGFWILSEEPQCAPGIYGFSLLVLQRSWPNVAFPPVVRTAHSMLQSCIWTEFCWLFLLLHLIHLLNL